MLALSRKESDSLQIVDQETGETITIAVAKLRGNRTTLGIEASDRFRIYRSELVESNGRVPKGK